MITKFNFEVLRAALLRGGVWFVNDRGRPTSFYHRKCFNISNVDI